MAFDGEFVPRLAIDGHNAAVARVLAIDAEYAMHRRADALDDAGFVAIVGARQPCEHAFANAERGSGIAVATRNDDNPWRRFVPLPALRPCEQIAVGILSCNFESRDFGKSARRRIAAPRVARDCALAFQFFENAFEGDAIGTFYAERAGEIT